MSAAALPFTDRLATEADLPALDAVMERAIAALQNDFLTPEQVRASHKVMGLDRQLVADRTYFIVERDGVIAGCGGWSWRSTLYGGDTSIVAREPRALDPATEPARIRAMYTEPSFARQGVGRRVMHLCEQAARDAGFAAATMMATLAGIPLYAACGYQPVEEVLSDPIEGVRVPLVRMEKRLVPVI
ncbi:GNAT family N-acetyltransferase [Sphingomonas sp. ASV193]|uniref:GNAT family N-acetyltransferase n=1 Tax=Sphingomonas sp. ASV193 TaxID=3144405 RepID=UPI0032E9246C